MQLAQPSKPRPSEPLRRAFATAAAIAALAVTAAPAVASERGDSVDRYRATCGHLGVECLEDDRSENRKAKGGRAASRRCRRGGRDARARRAQAARRSSARRCKRRAGRSKRARARTAVPRDRA